MVDYRIIGCDVSDHLNHHWYLSGEYHSDQDTVKPVQNGHSQKVQFFSRPIIA